jgi:hypothetical protein
MRRSTPQQRKDNTPEAGLELVWAGWSFLTERRIPDQRQTYLVLLTPRRDSMAPQPSGTARQSMPTPHLAIDRFLSGAIGVSWDEVLQSAPKSLAGPLVDTAARPHLK